MLSTLRNAWKVPELRKRLIWTFVLVAIFRIGNHIPVPGIDTTSLDNLTKSGSLFGFYDLISGGAFKRFSIFALGVVPYINASIIMSLLNISIPQLEQLSKEGEEGRKKIQKITRYASIAFGFITAYGTYVLIHNLGALKTDTPFNTFLIMLTLVVGSTFCMWLGDQITVKGIGNGISLLIFVNIISRFPQTLSAVLSTQSKGDTNIVEVFLLAVASLALLAAVIFLSLSERRITVQYAGKAVGGKVYKGQSTHIPLSLIGSTVIAIIFAMSVMQFPNVIAQFFPTKEWSKWIIAGTWSPFNKDTWLYLVIYAILTIFFTWFYTQVTFKPEEMSENMHKSAGFIPGIRPGQPTADYLTRLLDRISLLGGIFAAIIAVSPLLVENYTAFKGLSFGGTSLLILVSVSLEVMRQLQSQLVMRHYQGFLK
ncbi:preprotein translocase subunit SecY [Clostridium folliculivorans]|uniref:Protein translocase subunit SecY n=1 Tax=Clostridium folliculivorans TaxID=2886038 RepID=A0A9W5Y8U8_9CLOT|nr:preprotein translocase subunit SecY [Clostridium folliculivorans]GKU27792.1 protein translocase subunit SecY [Clostridium folliculivorans]GKU31809.1 protein translocase subunit SecY [Clostridium folliculivorans]